ncbi:MULTISPECIES: hypothetical protein [unclassified Streptomyces]|uniref:hypothetical protein n=1 Tax=unclassified Streptomyces TaxID=2593676 RepID=UPI000DD5E445|nr:MULTISPECIES: hypothetical protein [unclassified Streptomyces]QZZ26572.1 hypothetical protein A7X85_10155 [Streptomyces sp. ST1015]
MIPEVTIGAAVILAALIGATGLARWWVAPESAGRHRAGTPRPVEARVTATAYCRACRHTTCHTVTRIHGERICHGCGHITSHAEEVA